MECKEIISDIIKIEAYAVKDLSLSIPFTHERVAKASAVSITGDPIRIILKDESAEAQCAMKATESGDRFENSLKWQMDDNSVEALRQASRLSAGRFHYMLYTYGGLRKLIYNWCASGRTLPDMSLSGDSETTALSFSVVGRHPILTLV